MIGATRSIQNISSPSLPAVDTIQKADLPHDLFESAPARSSDAPLAAGEARLLGRATLEGTNFKPCAAVWMADKDGYINIVISDEADLAEQLRRHTRGQLAHRLYMNAAPAPWGRTASTLHGHVGFLQYPQDTGDHYSRSQVTLSGKVTANLSPAGTLRGRFDALGPDAGSWSKKATGEFEATHLDLAGDPEQAAAISALCAGWRPHVIKFTTKSMSHDFISISRGNASVSRAVAAMRVGSAADDEALPAEGLSFLATQHALNTLGWQALARVCAFFDIGSDAVALPSTDELTGRWLWSQTRALRKAREEVLAVIQQRHGGTDLALHFDDARQPGSAHRELYLSFKNAVSETKWIIPGLVRRTITTGPGNTVYVPIIGEHQDEDGPTIDSLAGEGATFAERGARAFLRERAGKFSPTAA